jgi:hypothetical protein
MTLFGIRRPNVLKLYTTINQQNNHEGRRHAVFSSRLNLSHVEIFS